MINLTPMMHLALLLVRPGALIMFSPAFGGEAAPAPAKIGVTVFLALALLPVTQPLAVSDTLPLTIIVTRELAIGLALALAIRSLIGAAEFAGHLIGFQMGLSYGATVDPQSGVRNPLLSVLYQNLALLTFFLINGHHAFLRALRQSYIDLPPGTGSIAASVPESAAAMLGLVFVIAVRLAAPVVLVLVFVEVAMALMARSAPALNLMAVGAPVRLLIGLLVLAVAIPTVSSLIAGASNSILPMAARLAGAFR